MPQNKHPHPPILYTEEQLMSRLKFFIGICLALTLTGIVFVVLYSLIFVTQPLNAISPIDQKFFELIIPIATFLTGTLSGIMLAGGDKDAQRAALDAANRPTSVSPLPPTSPPSGGFGNVPSFTPSTSITPAFGTPQTGGFATPTPAFTTGGFGSTPAPTGFGDNSGFGAPAPGASTAAGAGQVVVGFGGKPAPAPQVDPVI